MNPLQKELVEYAIKMRKRGDTYRYIRTCLDRKTEDEELKVAVIKVVNELEETKQLSTPKVVKSKYNIVMGAIFAVFGLFLAIFFWSIGELGMMPFVLIITGLAAMIGYWISPYSD